MEWVIGLVIVLAIVGMIGNATEKEKKRKEQEAEVKLRKERSESARQAILASGDKEMIQKLHLMEAGYASNNAGSAAPVPNSGKQGPGLIGTAAAVAGGMVVGNAVTGAIQAAELEAALQDIQADFEADMQLDFASMDSTDIAADDDFDLEI